MHQRHKNMTDIKIFSSYSDPNQYISALSSLSIPIHPSTGALFKKLAQLKLATALERVLLCLMQEPDPRLKLIFILNIQHIWTCSNRGKEKNGIYSIYIASRLCFFFFNLDLCLLALVFYVFLNIVAKTFLKF